MPARHNADLTGFAALLGDSFSAKINLLTQIIQGHHYPSLGRYKERLLAKTIAEYLPKDYEVGTGFVLFAHDATSERAKKPGFDDMNMGSHSISRQCDILVYDSARIPVVFRDDDFVVVRPESVRAIIEVKGSANTKEIGESLHSLLDFGQKWRSCQLFYHARYQPLTPSPSLYVMCWDVSRNQKGRELTNGTRIRKQVAEFYKNRINLGELKGFPRVNKILVYNNCEISRTAWMHRDPPRIEEGYSTESGQFLRHDVANGFHLKGDRTVASLLASLHFTTGGEFNRFYSYADEMRRISPQDYRDTFSSWLTDETYIRDANTDYVIDKGE